METEQALTPEKIREVFSRNRGAGVRLAREIGVSQTAISLVLSGGTKSARIRRALERRARQLLAREGRAA